MLAMNFIPQIHEKRRRHEDVMESVDDMVLINKRIRRNPSSSLYETCGENIHPQDNTWGKDICEMDKVSASDEVNPYAMMESDSITYMEQPTNTILSPKTTPSGHKGRSMNDYCTVLTSKKPNSERVVRFDEGSLDSMQTQMNVSTLCHGCKIDMGGNSYLIQCSFCNRSFCGSNCVCHCENCGGVFCHSTCSTLNYSSIFVKTLCLECNHEYNQHSYYKK